MGKEVAFRADAAFAKPEIYQALEARGVKHAIRASLPGGELEDAPAGGGEGGASCGRVVPARGVHRNQFGPAEPGGGGVYNKRGTAEQWIKEGKQAMKMTRLSWHRFRSNEVRLWLSVIAYNLGNLWRRLVLPKRIDNWSLTSLQQRLVKTGGRLVKHSRYYWLLLAESHLTRRLFASMLGRIAGLPVPTGLPGLCSKKVDSGVPGTSGV